MPLFSIFTRWGYSRLGKKIIQGRSAQSVERKIYDISEIPKPKALPERFMFPFSQLNFLLNGGIMDRVTLITSSTNNGKTMLTSQIIEYIIEQGYNCCCAFMEDTAYETQDRLFKQTLKSNTGAVKYVPYQVRGKDTNCGEWIIDDEYWNKAAEKFRGKLKIYNTRASATVDEILDGFDEARTKFGCRVFVIDNCDQFEFASDNENKALRDIVIKIRDYAINNKVHIFLISHIRKLERDVVMPNLNDVKGTSALVNIAKNVIIALRTDVMDKSSKAYKALAAVVSKNDYDLSECDELLYVAKTKGRKLGYVGLKYNAITNTYYEPAEWNVGKKQNVEKAATEKAVLYNGEKATLQYGAKDTETNWETLSDGEELPF